MKWIKTHLITRSGILFSVFFLALLFSCLFGINNTYALDDIVVTSSLSKPCDGSPCTSSDFKYLIVESDYDSGFALSSYTSRITICRSSDLSTCFRLTTFNSMTYNFYFIHSDIVIDSIEIANSSSFHGKVTLTNTLPSFCSFVPSGSLSITENGTYDVTNYAEVVVDVPETVIQGDYHDDLVSINNSILICAAVCLVIYFFYCIYRMIIRPLRS